MLSSDNYLSTIETSLSFFVNKYAKGDHYFACLGERDHFAEEIVIFSKLFWQESEKVKKGLLEKRINCLLISFNRDLHPSIGGQIRDKKPSIIILNIPSKKKKSRIFAEFETYGYRIYREWEEIAFLYLPASSIQIISTNHQLGDKKMRHLLEQSWRRICNLPENTKADQILIDAKELLTSRRFDIAIKSHYARLWLAGLGKLWREYAYYEHILRITGPSQEIIEYGTEKKGLDSFYKNFHSLLEEHTPEAIPTVPVDSTLIAFDGAHRIAAAIAKKSLIHAARIDSFTKSQATSTYFQGIEHAHPPCPQEILDEAAIEYCRIKDTVAIALIFPPIISEKAAIQDLSTVSEIVYRKDIHLSPQSGGDLLKQVYLGHSWLDITQDSPGFQNKKKGCFPFTGTLRVVLLDKVNPKTLRTAKERIRTLYGLGNNSIHITDSIHETLRVARVVFNQNSLDLIRIGLGRSQDFHDKLFLYRNWLEEHDINEELVAIDGSAILALLGLRECRDLDFLYHGQIDDLPASPNDIDCHNALKEYHQESISDILGDPRLHCWYMGVKFCAPQVVMNMKENRGEYKDKSDIIFLKSKLRGRKWYRMLKTWLRFKGFLYSLFASLIRRVKSMLRTMLNIC